MYKDDLVDADMYYLIFGIFDIILAKVVPLHATKALGGRGV
jgi:hypothetical protein